MRQQENDSSKGIKRQLPPYLCVRITCARFMPTSSKELLVGETPAADGLRNKDDIEKSCKKR